MSDTIKYCSKCGSKNIEVKEVYSHSKSVGWSDGMGSPGSMAFYKDVIVCRDCDGKSDAAT